MSVQSPGYPGLCCFRSISPAALRLDGLLVAGPVGFPAALRLAGLLASGAACGMGSPGEAFMPTPGKFTGARCEKSPYLRTSSHLEYGGEGGIDSLRSPLLGPSMGLAPSGPTQALFKNAPGVFVGAARLLRSRSVQLAAPVVDPRSGVLIPPNGEYKRKEPVLSYELLSRIWR